MGGLEGVLILKLRVTKKFLVFDSVLTIILRFGLQQERTVNPFHKSGVVFGIRML